MSEFVQGTPNPTDDELRAIAKRGRDAYSLATDNGWSERESNLAAYEALYVAGRVAGLEEAATIADDSAAVHSMIVFGGQLVQSPESLAIAARIRARLGDTGTENQNA